jgi:uncharacterized protein (TIGR02444 family)
VTADLREFALAVYAADGVAPACLLLQGRFGLDVNLMLFAAYVGAARGHTLTSVALDAAKAHVAPWHSEVVRPIRTVREGLKSGPSPAPNPTTAGLREQIKELEIQAELIELDELDRLALPSDPASGAALDRARAALQVVVLATACREPANDERAALTTIATAAARLVETVS